MLSSFSSTSIFENSVLSLIRISSRVTLIAFSIFIVCEVRFYSGLSADLFSITLTLTSESFESLLFGFVVLSLETDLFTKNCWMIPYRVDVPQ